MSDKLLEGFVFMKVVFAIRNCGGRQTDKTPRIKLEGIFSVIHGNLHKH